MAVLASDSTDLEDAKITSKLPRDLPNSRIHSQACMELGKQQDWNCNPSMVHTGLIGSHSNQQEKRGSRLSSVVSTYSQLEYE